jgi:asparagine synthase (glutamine-hydrolysing)
LPRWAQLYDEPFGDSSGIPTYLVSQVASESVKVVLSADGGDELFSGYNLYASVLARESRLKSVPAWLRQLGARCLNGLPIAALERFAAAAAPGQPGVGVVFGQAVSRARRLGPLLRGGAHGTTYEAAVSHWTPLEIRDLLGVSAAQRNLASSYPGALAQQMATWDLHHYLPDDILTKVDRATMAASIEGREPLLDHRLVEFAFRLPLSMKRGALGTKHLLKKVLYKYVPRTLIDRPKQGFGVPVNSWLRAELSSLLDRYLNPRRIEDAGLFDAAQVQRNVRLFRAGCDHYATKVWLLLAFEMWREQWAQ